MESIINPSYLTQESIKRLAETRKEKTDFPSLILTKFFTEEFYREKEKKTKGLKYKRETQPDLYSRAFAKANPLHIIDNKELLAFLTAILHRPVRRIDGAAYYFSWKDYTLLHKKTEEKPGIDIIIDFTEHWKEEYGGAVIYKDDKGKYLKLLPIKNTLYIIERKPGTQKYLQYVNNLSKGKKRFLIIGTVK